MFPKAGFVTKNTNRNQRMSDAEVKTSIETLQDAITGIFHRQSSQMSFENLYRKSYNLVTHKHGDELSRGLREVLTMNIKDHLEKLKSCPEDQLLNELIGEWNKFYEALNTVKDILMYYDRHHVKLTNEKTSFQLGLQLFSELVLKDENLSSIIPRIVESFIDDREGHGSKILLDSLNSLVRMLVDLGIEVDSLYVNKFEPLFLERSRTYYHDTSAIQIAQLDASSYVNLAFKWLETENEYCSFLYENTANELMRIVKEEVIENHSLHLLETQNGGFLFMVNNHLYSSLNRLYTLFKDVLPALLNLKNKFSEYIKSNILSLLKQTSIDPVEWTQNLVNFYISNDTMVSSAFQDSNDFHELIKSVIRDTLQQEFAPCDCLSAYLDTKLRENMEEQPFREVINQSLNIFQLIPNKDYFKAAYEKTLIRRILDSKISREEHERYILTKLKEIMYPQYTENLEKLFTDYNTGIEQKSQISNRIKADTSLLKKLPFELTMLPLAQGIWPLDNYEKCNLPPEFENVINSMNRLYSVMEPRKILTWIISEGNCVMRIKNSPLVLSVTVIQCFILLLFNSHECLSVSEISAKLNIPQKVLFSHLSPLLFRKEQFLIKVGGSTGSSNNGSSGANSKKLDEKDILKFNKNFKTNKINLTISQAKLKLKVNNNKQPEDILLLRKNQLDSCIVRIMKTHNQLSKVDLEAQILRILKDIYKPNSSEIKTRIENLIEREYIRRDPDNQDMFYYVA